MSAAERAGIKPTGANHNLWQIAKLGDVIELEQALARGADVNACNNLGLTPLMMAAYHGQKDMVKALVEHGADINAVDNGGLTAAMLAEDSDHAEVVRTLVALGVKKRPAVPKPESSSDRVSKSELDDVSDNSQETSTVKGPVVRTLGEPPEIWDLVQETRSEFKPSSTLTARLFKLHPLVLTGILVVIGCGVGIFFAALGTRTTTATLPPQTDHSAPASLPPTSDRTNAKGPSNSNSPSSDQKLSSAKQVTKAPSASNAVRPTIDALRLFVAGVAAESSREQVATKPEVDNEGMANHARVASDASEDGARPAPRSSRTSMALSRNNRRAALGRQAEDEDEGARTVAKQAEKTPSQESTSPAKPDPTPKPKVIPWP
jgi:ankyrin repeat protein